MKLAIDFGTSYSAAAFLTQGKVELIQFGGDNQFRTAVFFPAKVPSVTDFTVTAGIEREIANTVQRSKAEQTRELQRIEGLRKAANKIKDVKDREKALRLIPEVRTRTDDELHREALDAARRNWLSEQTHAALSGAASLDDALYGEDAIDAYLQDGAGHLVSSPKSMLGYSLVGEARSILTGVTSRILWHIREQAGRQAGATFDELLLGRPVKFKSSKGETGSLQAIEIIRTAALAAGFRSVDFLEEPVAACWHVHQTSDERRLKTLIVDIGGGTTDLAVGMVGGSSPHPSMERAWGLPQGGTDIDVSLSMKAFMPAFGKNQHDIPNHLFYQASTVHDQVRQREFAASHVASYPKPFGDRLARLQKPGATVRLNRAVERLKIRLSDKQLASVRLGYIDNGLTVSASRADLEACSESYCSELTRLIRQAIAESGTVDVVYVTGGASRSPFLRTVVQSAAGASKVIIGEPSLSVIQGLARATQ